MIATAENPLSTSALSAPGVLETLDRDGIVVLPDLVNREQLAGMQNAFASRLGRLQWNDVEGYERSERFRRMVNDVLQLDQGFVDLALHPLVNQTLRRYIGAYSLAEAKGWESLPTNVNFHGWHSDMWYDQTRVNHIPRECKLAMYLTDVKSGAFNYVKGSHRKMAPRNLQKSEVGNIPKDDIVEMIGKAGTAFLFDTSGIHRQAFPILEPRQAIFYCYHDPATPLMDEYLKYYRYHPLILNAAFLGNLSSDNQSVLGFGDKAGFQPAYRRDSSQYPLVAAIAGACLGVSLVASEWQDKIVRRTRRLLGLRK